MQQMGIKGESIVFIRGFYRVIIFSMSPIFTILQKSLFQRGGGGADCAHHITVITNFDMKISKKGFHRKSF